jgi:hypothetical protein
LFDVSNSVPDPDPPDPHSFGPPGTFYHASIIKQK